MVLLQNGKAVIAASEIFGFKRHGFIAKR